LWQRARLRRDEDEDRERRVGWLELFYDLVFVVVISQVSHKLGEDVSWAGLGAYVLLFASSWWVWIGGTIYAERFENDDVAHRIFTFLQMLPVAGMAAFTHDGLGHTSTGFALSYVAARAILIGLWLRGGLHDGPAFPTACRFASGFGFAALLWVASIAAPAPAKFVLWAVAMAIDTLTPLMTVRVQALMPKLSTSRLPERFGLFTLIVLGESVLGVVNGIASVLHPTLATFVAAVIGMGIAFAIWWVYFDMVWRKLPHPSVAGSMARSYLHLPLTLSITAIGAGIAQVVAQGNELPDDMRWLITGACATVMVVLASFQAALQQPPEERALVRSVVASLIVGALGALGIGALGHGIGSIAALAGLLGLLGVPVVTGSVWWFRQEERVAKHSH
jgi:low temperature requirement protein LtrA